MARSGLKEFGQFCQKMQCDPLKAIKRPLKEASMIYLQVETYAFFRFYPWGLSHSFFPGPPQVIRDSLVIQC